MAVPNTGFWVALASPTHTKSTVERKLDPAPSAIEYPNGPHGQMIETADGRVVMQQSTKDPRRRTWIWSGFFSNIANYERQYNWLESLRSRIRLQQGYSPYVYIYDGTSKLLNQRKVLTTTPSGRVGATFTVPDFSATVDPLTLKHAAVDLVSGSGEAAERVSVVGATATTLTLEPNPTMANVSQLVVRWLEPVWVRARILDTSRVLASSGGPTRYSESRLTFIIDDPNYVEVG